MDSFLELHGIEVVPVGVGIEARIVRDRRARYGIRESRDGDGILAAIFSGFDTDMFEPLRLGVKYDLLGVEPLTY